ncbi:putative cell division cycle protein [Diaporthe ampelina]|uniref:Putative cell division cycle protein n=1 Tax=Diaporthe ampelina TaxID=1214573 RepID=A0A0G2FKL0_9PEZI|nr:putative cell division cycle protein [Diaporthe ampelina]
MARAVSGKTTYSIQDLLRQVKAPDWSLPDDVVDSVVFGIVASKSDPRHHKPQYDAETGKMKQSDRGKYMVINLVDLQYEVELFLFNSGFERFWKLSTGTVVAILNPDIMPPPPGRADTGRFSLTINSDADTILELGVARDLGYCKSVKADGSLCNSWVNARRTEHCEFHTNTALSRTRSARQEINGTGGLGNGFKGHRSQDRTWKESAEAKRQAKVEEEHGKFDRETRSRYFMNGGGRGQSASSLIDRDGIFADTKERAEGLKRKLAAQEKERDIAKKLGEMGSGSMGGEYMRISGAQPAPESSRAGSRATSRLSGTRGPRTVPSSSTFKPEVRLPGISLPTDQHQPRKTDARSLGLLAPRGSTGSKISLSPIKRKRQDSTLSSNSSLFDSKPPAASSSYAATATSRLSAATGRPAGGFGWGTSLRDKLSRMKAGERLSLHTSHNSTSTTASSSGSSGAGIGTGGAAGGAFRDKDRSPVRKKTRFVTEKGIREAGRESLPGSVVADPGASRGWNGQLASRQRLRQQDVVLEGDNDDDDDDELVVVR